MSVEFKLPELGENIETGDVVKVLVSPGDSVVPDQSVVELETDKATIEVPINVGGVIELVDVKPGDRIHIGQRLLTLAEAQVEAAPKPPAREAPVVPERPTVVAPARGGSDVGAEREPGPGPQSDRSRALPAGDGRRRGGEVVAIGRPARASGSAAPSDGAAAAAAPSVRRLARELGIDISRVEGTGSAGRISMDDVKTYSRTLAEGGGQVPSGPAAEVSLPDFEKWGPVERQRMSGIRRKTATHLSRAWSTIPHVTQHDTADVTELEALRRRFDPVVQQAGGKLTVTAIAIKVVAAALKRFPQVNASVDLEREAIILKQYVHVGVAVDTDRGLLVPVIRDVDQKNMVELAVELGQLAERAKAGKLTIAEMSGGCFTITNLGGIGGSHFTPIVNWPEVAILGISRATIQPAYVNDELVPRLRLPLSLSYDHRVVDGAEAIRFLRWVVGALEQPFLLSREG